MRAHLRANWTSGSGSEKIDLSACEESDFDETPRGAARLFPLEGGSVRTSGWTADLLAGEVVAASGFEDICTVLDASPPERARRSSNRFSARRVASTVPAMPGDRNLFFCRQRRPGLCGRRGTGRDRSSVMAVSRQDIHRLRKTLQSRERHGGQSHSRRRGPGIAQATSPACDRYGDLEPRISEEQIRPVLEMTGKAREEDQLNCGACGYATCRDKAVAVIRGMAEPEMCIPHMKRLAEQRVDRIIETSPNGIVVLDEHLRILHMNPAFQKFFMCSEAVYGQPISCLMDPEPFERLASGQEQNVEMTVEHKQYNLVCHQILYPLREEQQYVGILVNVTHSQAQPAEARPPPGRRR